MSSSEIASLPSPDDRPDADVVLYDGKCVFCRKQVSRLAWWDCCGKLAYLSLHDEQVAERWPDVDTQRLYDEMCVIEREGSKHPGRQHWGAEAVRYLSLRLRRLWWLAPVMWLPGAMLVAKPVYRWVARNRYKLMGRTEECETGACSLHNSSGRAGGR